MSGTYPELDVPTLSLLASCEFALNRPQKALWYYQFLLQKQTEVSFLLGRLYRNLAFVYTANHQLISGIDCIERAHQILPSSNQLLLDEIGISLQQTPDQWEFLELLYQLLRIEEQSTNIPPALLIQMTFWKLQLFREANANDQIIDECRKTLSRKLCTLAQHRQILFILIETFCNKRKLKEALECLSAGCTWVAYPEGVQKGMQGEKEGLTEEEKEYAGDVLYNKTQVREKMND